MKEFNVLVIFSFFYDNINDNNIKTPDIKSFAHIN